MENKEILKHVDHTILRAVSSWKEVQKLCEEAIENETASVCIPPSYIKRVADVYGDKITICTVIGFPLGYNTTSVKAYETKQAIEDGATEIDMVVNLGDVKNGEFDKVKEEIHILKEICGTNILKVIVESCYLTQEEKVKLCECVTEGEADYIKTSTGFGTGGAKIEDIELFKQHIGVDVKMKAAGGIRTKEDMEMFLKSGCERIGTSSAVKLLAEFK